MTKHIDHIVEQGVIAGLVTPSVEDVTQMVRPWPVILFAGIGAWFTAIPFAVVLFILCMNVHGNAPMLAFFGMCTFAGTATALCNRRQSLFLQQLALAGLVAGSLVLFFSIAIGTENLALASFAVFCALGVVAFLTPQPWLRILLSAACTATGVFSMQFI